jgi:hypothetical protein
MLTTSASRVEVIVKECPEEYRHNLIHVTTYQDAQHCKVLNSFQHCLLKRRGYS